jgi:hypothetical protein
MSCREARLLIRGVHYSVHTAACLPHRPSCSVPCVRPGSSLRMQTRGSSGTHGVGALTRGCQRVVRWGSRQQGIVYVPFLWPALLLCTWRSTCVSGGTDGKQCSLQAAMADPIFGYCDGLTHLPCAPTCMVQVLALMLRSNALASPAPLPAGHQVPSGLSVDMSCSCTGITPKSNQLVHWVVAGAGQEHTNISRHA